MRTKRWIVGALLALTATAGLTISSMGPAMAAASNHVTVSIPAETPAAAAAPLVNVPTSSSAQPGAGSAMPAIPAGQKLGLVNPATSVQVTAANAKSLGFIPASVNAAGADVVICTFSAFKSYQFHTWATEEDRYTYPYQYLLRARSSVIGAWQGFQWCTDQNTFRTYFRSRANGRWVNVGIAPYAGQLQASATTMGTGQAFYFYCNAGVGAPAAFSLWAVANNRYVTVEGGFKQPLADMMRAARTADGNWERFLLQNNTTNCGTILAGPVYPVTTTSFTAVVHPVSLQVAVRAEPKARLVLAT